MAAKKKTEAGRLADQICEFVDREDISASVALESLRPARVAQFASESEYRDWFVQEALPSVMPQITGGM